MNLQMIFAGFGGQGVLLMGQLIAYAGMVMGKEVSWMPSYGPEMRGGSANCSVVVSDEPVGSPRVEDADVVVAMNKPSLAVFEKSVVPGGLLIYNSSLIDVKPTRTDIRVAAIPRQRHRGGAGQRQGDQHGHARRRGRAHRRLYGRRAGGRHAPQVRPLQGTHDAQEPRGYRARHGGCEGLRKCFCPSAISSK